MFDFLHAIFIKATSAVVALFLFLGISGTQPLNLPEVTGQTSQTTTTKIIEARSESAEKTAPTEREVLLIPKDKKIVITSSGDLTIQMPPPPEIKAPTLLSTSFLNEKARSATVNIFCLTKTGGILDPISGSGVIINEAGVIITSAHVAQYYLLKDYLTKNFIECTVRTGSPATPTYTLEPLYLPPIWIESNAEKIKSDAPMGTGEYDFALFRIVGPISEGNTLPTAFPFIEPANPDEQLVEGSSVFLAGYSAGFIDNLSVSKNLWLSTSIASLKNFFVFHDGGKTPDLLALSGTTAAQEGASGGAVIDFVDGKLWGLIAARTAGNTTEERELRAITISHVSDTLEDYTGKTLAEFISGDLTKEGLYFNTFVAPKLTKILTDTLDDAKSGH
ncbi:MAG TPA: serine protease [Candidatus Paceibacterota bacterium]